MSRAVKRGSALYGFLETTGLLEHGTKEDIAAAKKMYWSQVRKAWKQTHRKEYKSYTICFSPKEHSLLASEANTTTSSINKFIKNACMQMMVGSSGMNKKTIGKVREALMLFHSELQNLDKDLHHSNTHIKLIIEKFATLENSILSLLKHN
jgi:hypothetical protein